LASDQIGGCREGNGWEKSDSGELHFDYVGLEEKADLERKVGNGGN
jgi:hypothetical protein